MPRSCTVSVKPMKFGTGGTKIVQVGGSTQNVPWAARNSLIGRCVVPASAVADQTQTPRAKAVETMRRADRASFTIMAFLSRRIGRAHYRNPPPRASGHHLTLCDAPAASPRIVCDLVGQNRAGVDDLEVAAVNLPERADDGVHVRVPAVVRVAGDEP